MGHRRHRSLPDRPAAPAPSRETPGADLFKRLIWLPVGLTVAYLGTAIAQHEAPGGAFALAAAVLSLPAVALAWMWGANAWRRYSDWRLVVAVALAVAASGFITIAASRPDLCPRRDPFPVQVTGDVAVAAGAAWVTDATDSVVIRLSLRRRDPPVTVPVNKPFELASDGHSLWVTSQQPPAVTEVDPARNAVVRSFSLSAPPTDIAADSRYVWMAFRDRGSVVRLDPGSGELRAFPVGTSPVSLAIGGRYLWVTDDRTNQLYGVDVETGVTGKTLATGNGPQGVFATDGTVWVANTGDRTVAGYQVATGQMATPFRVTDAPTDLAVEHDRLWVLSQDESRVSVFDTSTGRRIHWFPTDGKPLKIELSEGSAFVTVPEAGQLVEIPVGCALLDQPDR